MQLKFGLEINYSNINLYNNYYYYWNYIGSFRSLLNLPSLISVTSSLAVDSLTTITSSYIGIVGVFFLYLLAYSLRPIWICYIACLVSLTSSLIILFSFSS